MGDQPRPVNRAAKNGSLPGPNDLAQNGFHVAVGVNLT
jgi:hypothetical protein